MSQVPDLLNLLKSGVHFGHKLSKRHPKMEPYIFTAKNGFHIINVEETQIKLARAAEFIKQTVAKGGIILFVGTKKQARSIIAEAATSCGMPFITERWLGGTFTNFTAIHKLITTYKTLTSQKASGELEAKYTKREQLDFDHEIARLHKFIGGATELNRIPDAIFVCDTKKEKTAVAEAIRKQVPIIAMCDTNSNPDVITYPIPSNDDAIKSIKLIVDFVAQTIIEAKHERAAAVASMPVQATPVAPAA